MADISKFKIGNTIYNLKDMDSRSRLTTIESTLSSALTYKGTINSSAELEGLEDYKTGWCYKATSRFFIDNLGWIDVGDMLIAQADYNPLNITVVDSQQIELGDAVSYTNSSFPIGQQMYVYFELDHNNTYYNTVEEYTPLINADSSNFGGSIELDLNSSLNQNWTFVFTNRGVIDIYDNETDGSINSIEDEYTFHRIVIKTKQFNASEWTAIQNNTDIFIGSSNESDGASGLVPAPGTSDVNKFLKGNGQWAEQIQSDWNAISGPALILNKPYITNLPEPTNDDENKVLTAYRGTYWQEVIDLDQTHFGDQVQPSYQIEKGQTVRVVFNLSEPVNEVSYCDTTAKVTSTGIKISLNARTFFVYNPNTDVVDLVNRGSISYLDVSNPNSPSFRNIYIGVELDKEDLDIGWKSINITTDNITQGTDNFILDCGTSTINV